MAEMKYAPCPTCKMWHWTDRPHTCPPTWDWRYFYTDDKANDWTVGEIYARDEEDAALAAARAYDEEDYPLSRGNEIDIEVRRTGSEEATRWTASADMVPSYHVSPNGYP